MTVEWLGGEDVDELPPPPPVGPAKRRAIWIGGAVLVVALGTGVAVSQGGGSGKSKAAVTTSPPVVSSTPAPSTSASRSPTNPRSTTASATARPRVTEVGRRILGATSNWELFAHSGSTLLRIEMAAGRIQTTQLPDLATSGGVGFVVGPASVILRPFDAVDGYVVPDGGSPRVLRGLLARAASVYAGPSADKVWVQTETSGTNTPAPRLYDLRADRPIDTGPTAPPELGQPFMSDGSGYLLYSGVGGVYDVRPDGVRRVTTGALAAVGAHSWLVQECDERFRCSNVLVDQRAGTRRSLGATHASFTYLPGSISPDGRFAVYTTVVNNGQPTTHLVNLGAGGDTDLAITPSDSAYGSNPFVWDPDNGALIFVDNQGVIQVVDPATSKASALDVGLPVVDQIGIRAATD